MTADSFYEILKPAVQSDDHDIMIRIVEENGFKEIRIMTPHSTRFGYYRGQMDDQDYSEAEVTAVTQIEEHTYCFFHLGYGIEQYQQVSSKNAVKRNMRSMASLSIKRAGYEEI